MASSSPPLQRPERQHPKTPARNPKGRSAYDPSHREYGLAAQDDVNDHAYDIQRLKDRWEQLSDRFREPEADSDDEDTLRQRLENNQYQQALQSAAANKLKNRRAGAEQQMRNIRLMAENVRSVDGKGFIQQTRMAMLGLLTDTQKFSSAEEDSRYTSQPQMRSTSLILDGNTTLDLKRFKVLRRIMFDDEDQAWSIDDAQTWSIDAILDQAVAFRKLNERLDTQRADYFDRMTSAQSDLEDAKKESSERKVRLIHYEKVLATDRTKLGIAKDHADDKEREVVSERQKCEEKLSEQLKVQRKRLINEHIEREAIRLKDLGDQKEELRRAIETRLEESQQQNRDLQATVSQMRTAGSSVGSQVSKMQGELEVLRGNVDTESKKNKKLTADHDRDSKNIADLQAHLTTRTELLDAEEQRTEQLRKQIEQHKTTITEKDQLLRDHSRDIEDNVRVIDRLRIQIGESKGVAERATDDKRQAESELSELQVHFHELKMQKSALDSTVREKDTEIGKRDTTIGSKSQQLSELQEKLDTANETILQGIQKELQGDERVRKALADLNAQRETLKASHVQKSVHDQVVDELGSQRSRVAELEDSLRDDHVTLDAHQLVEDQATASATMVKDLQARATAISKVVLPPAQICYVGQLRHLFGAHPVAPNTIYDHLAEDYIAAEKTMKEPIDIRHHKRDYDVTRSLVFLDWGVSHVEGQNLSDYPSGVYVNTLLLQVCRGVGHDGIVELVELLIHDHMTKGFQKIDLHLLYRAALRYIKSMSYRMTKLSKVDRVRTCLAGARLVEVTIRAQAVCLSGSAVFHSAALPIPDLLDVLRSAVDRYKLNTPGFLQCLMQWLGRAVRGDESLADWPGWEMTMRNALMPIANSSNGSGMFVRDEHLVIVMRGNDVFLYHPCNIAWCISIEGIGMVMRGTRRAVIDGGAELSAQLPPLFFDNADLISSQA